MKINKGKATCVHTVTNEEQTFGISELICVAKNGEPIYPCLKFVDSVQPFFSRKFSQKSTISYLSEQFSAKIT